MVVLASKNDNKKKKDKKKKKNSSGGFIRILAIIFFITLVYVGFAYRGVKNEPDANVDKSQYETILAVDLEQSYPNGPYEVLFYYYTIVQYIYGGECQLDEVPILIEKQRMLFANDLLELNPYDTQVENCESIVEFLYENNQRLLKVEQHMPVTDDENEDITYSDVTEYYSTGTRTNLKFTLILENKHWKILRWDVVDLEEQTE